MPKEKGRGFLELYLIKVNLLLFRESTICSSVSLVMTFLWGWILKSKILGQKSTYLHTQRKQFYFVNKMYDSSSKIGHDFSK